jgi:hypothetical protein
VASLTLSPSSVDTEAVAGNSWSNTTNILSSNNSYAEASAIGGFSPTDYLIALFDFSSLPAADSIDGFTIAIEWKSDISSGTSEILAQLVHNGSDVGTPQDSFGNANSTTDSTKNFGGATNLLGATLTPAQVRDGTFGCKFYFADDAGFDVAWFVDHVQITVHYTPGNLLTDLISYWELEEASGTRVDSHGSNDLTDTNTVTQATGKVGNAAQFTRANSETLVKTGPSGLPSGAEAAITVTSWLYFDSIGAPSAYPWSIVKSDGSAARFYLARDDTTNKLILTVMWDGSTYAQVTSTPAVTTGTWYFVVAWYDPTANKAYLQINNGTPDEVAFSSGLNTGAVDLYLGSYRNVTGFLDGRIDEVGIWSRVLASDERTSLYNGGAGIGYDDLDGGGASDTRSIIIGGDLFRPPIIGGSLVQ